VKSMLWPVTLAVGIACASATRSALAEELDRIDRDTATKIARQLCRTVQKLDDLGFEIEPDPNQADGVHYEEDAAMLIVPQRGIKEEDKDSPELEEPKGAAFALLFSYHIAPIINGVPADEAKLRSITYVDEDGDEYKVYVFVLAVRRLSEDEYKLYVYGRDDNPLVEAEFSEAEGPGIEPLAVQVVDVVGTEGTCLVNVFNKYQASFGVAYKP